MLDPNLETLASYIELNDVIVDVGGGAGRVSLPLALRCRELINVEPSRTMGAGFTANAGRPGEPRYLSHAGDRAVHSEVGTGGPATRHDYGRQPAAAILAEAREKSFTAVFV